MDAHGAHHLDQQFVADLVAEGVVDRLEVVQVDDRQGARRQAELMGLQGVGHVDVERAPVQCLGQWVMDRQVFQRLPLAGRLQRENEGAQGHQQATAEEHRALDVVGEHFGMATEDGEHRHIGDHRHASGCQQEVGGQHRIGPQQAVAREQKRHRQATRRRHDGHQDPGARRLPGPPGDDTDRGHRDHDHRIDDPHDDLALREPVDRERQHDQRDQCGEEADQAELRVVGCTLDCGTPASRGRFPARALPAALRG